MLKNVVICGNIALQSFQIFYIIVLHVRAGIVTTFGSKMVTISTRKAIYSVSYNISRPTITFERFFSGNFVFLSVFDKINRRVIGRAK